ncbi:MAG: hypothetical protein D6715_08640 [Calditrichaeota bacterium]|nr:MAG: hypothetical protein D6715_08640 [Calditrichota bacterium]
MKGPFTQTLLFWFFLLSAPALAGGSVEWLKVGLPEDNPRIEAFIRAGVILVERDEHDAGWMRKSDYLRQQPYLKLPVLDAQIREEPRSRFADTLGQVLAVYRLADSLSTPAGLAILNGMFYLSDFTTGRERIYQLNPADSFKVVQWWPAPGSGYTLTLPWGLASDRQQALFLVDGLQGLIFRLDASAQVLANFPAPGPQGSGLGYRNGELWNADFGDFITIPPRMFRLDTLGAVLNQFPLGQISNGVAATDSLILVGTNKNNGKQILLFEPDLFQPVASFPSPLDFPNGLAFDGRYLWVAGKDQGANWMVKVDLALPPPRLPWTTFPLVTDGRFNNRFNAAFDSQGHVHLVYATQVGTVASSKEIMYATNRSGVWEFTQLTHDNTTDEFPNLLVDAGDVVHVWWHGFSVQDQDLEIFYTNNASGTFFPKMQLTSQSQDGINGHVWASLAIDAGGTLHFVFTSFDPLLPDEVYYATHSQGQTSLPVNISHTAQTDSDPQLVLDSQGNAHVLFMTLGSGLNYATNRSGSWQGQLITDMSLDRPALAIDGQDHLHFVVTRANLVKYGNDLSGSLQVTDTVAVHLSNCFYPQLKLDLQGNLHLTYHAFGDTSNTWPGKGEIFYTNNLLWSQGIFPVNLSQLPDEQELFPGLAVRNFDERVVGWSQQAPGVVSHIRMATTLPDSGGHLTGRIVLSDSSHNFGFLAPGDSANWAFSIRNSGIRLLTISNIQWQSAQNPPFEVTTNFAGPASLPFDSVLTVLVTARVLTALQNDTIPLSGTLKIHNNDPLSPVVEILLTAQSIVTGLDEETPLLPRQTRLLPAFPNPFNPGGWIPFYLASAGQVELRIYDVQGRLVRPLGQGRLPAGKHKFYWDGTSSRHRPVSSGTYFVSLRVNGKASGISKVVLIR